jgi:hypothetical protein
MEQKSFNWGRCTIFTKDLGTVGAKWKKQATPVEDSTNLTPTAGDKLEGTVEGGEVEVSKRKKSKYELDYNIRKLAGRKPPMKNVDGVVAHEYAVLLMPEDNAADGFFIERTSVGIDPNFTCAEGTAWAVVHDALKPSAGNTVKWGIVTASNGQVSFTENADMVADGDTPVSFTEPYEDNDTATTATYYQVQEDDTVGKNPKALGWYVKSGNTYTLTTDTTPQSGTTYYVKA